MAQDEREMKVVYERPHALLPVVTNYCPGCPHGIVERLVAETMDELDIEGSLAIINDCLNPYTTPVTEEMVRMVRGE